MRMIAGYMIALCCAAMPLAACHNGPLDSAGTAAPPGSTATKIDQALVDIQNAPAPCAQTQVDEQVVKAALLGYDAYLSWVDSQHYVRNSPAALQRRRQVIAIRAAINALEAAHAACSTTNWLTALDAVRTAFTDARAALK